MITFEEAYDIILNHTRDFGIETIPLRDSLHRILREEWSSDRDLPPYDRVTMDGIAFSYRETLDANHSFDIKGIAPAGSPQITLPEGNNCIEVMTGAVLPSGADTVMRYEDVRLTKDKAIILIKPIPKKNVHYKGMDRKKGSLVASSGTRISSPEISIGASIGKAHVSVSRLPKVVIISTGDELVDIHETPADHQIRKSNVHQIAALLRSYHIPSDMLHLLDNKDDITAKMSEVIDKYDVVLMSGGVSKGKYDFIPEALSAVGVEKLFHKVKQRPGKPFWFGQHGNGCTVFALPGNPVSSFMCARVYLISWIEQSMQLCPRSLPFAVLDHDFTFNPELTLFQEVKLTYNQNGQIIATPSKGNGSGDLVNMGSADAFLRLPSAKQHFKKGEKYPFYSYRILF